MKYKILAIDGGGIRGIFPIYILKRISEDYKIKNIIDKFDLIVGTSTGAIITGLLAANIDVNTIYNFYLEQGERVFKQKLLSRIPFNLFTTKYSKKQLALLLDRMIGDTKLCDLKKAIIITATDVKYGKAVLFRSNQGDFNTTLKKAILSSISAPYYFSFEKYHDSYLADGGLWASNPSIVGYIEARYFKLIPENDIHILSLGTGIDKGATYLNKNKLNIFEVDDFINLLLKLQANHLDALSNIILGRNFTKITIEDEDLTIDHLNPNFLEQMENYYQLYKEQIVQFIYN